MPHDSIMDIVNNTEPLYLDKNGLFEKWYRSGSWSRADALAEAKKLAKHFGDAIGGYGDSAHATAAREMVEEYLSDYKTYRDGKGGAMYGSSMGSHDALNVVMVDQTGTKKLPMKISASTLVGDIIQVIIAKMGLPITGHDGRPMVYSLDWKEGGVKLLETQTLADAGVRTGDSLIVFYEMIAGEMAGYCLGDAEALNVVMVDQTGTKKLRAKIAAATLVGDIIPMIITKMGLPITGHDGRPMVYSLDWKEGGVRLLETQTLSDAGVQTGDSLLVYHEMIAGEMAGYHMGSHDALNVVMVDQTGTKKLRAKIAAETLVGDIIPMIITKMGLPITGHDGRPMVYSLDWKEGGVRLLETQTLADAGVQTGDSLLVYHEMIAGEMAGY